MSYDEDKLRRALTEHAAATPEPRDRWDEVETTATRFHRDHQRRRIGLTALGVAAAMVATLVGVNALRDDDTHRIVTVPPATQGTGSESTASTPTTSSATAFSFPYQPLWPFADAAQAEQWRTKDGPAGHSPWHADAEITATSFATGYLAFTEMKTVASHTGTDRDAHIGVGYTSEDGKPHTAAILHLVRFGSAIDAPWEVVGSDDTDLTLTAPKYGATVTSPIAVGGRITGVDESTHVQVHEISSTTPIGDACCNAAGGVDSPWNMSVTYASATDAVLTIVVSTGGHYTGVERFAVTGVRRG